MRIFARARTHSCRHGRTRNVPARDRRLGTRRCDGHDLERRNHRRIAQSSPTNFARSGLRVTVYPEADKLGKQIKYADSIKVPWVCVLGESEIAAGNVTLKESETR